MLYVIVLAALEVDIFVFFLIFSGPWACRVYSTGAHDDPSVFVSKLCWLVANICIYLMLGRDGKEDGILVVS